MNNAIHTVIFDLDGTLSDSSVVTMEACKRVLPDYGLPMPAIDAVKRATGHPNPEFYYILFPDHDRDTVYKAGQQVEREEKHAISSLGDKLLFPGCRELLERLKEKGIRLCIASLGDEEHVLTILNSSGVIGFFETVLFAQPGKTEDKTEMLRELIGKSDKSGCVMVGDMKKDYEAARLNGIVSAGACYGYCKEDISEFDFYMYSPLELLDILNLKI